MQEWQKPEYFVRFADFVSLFVIHGMECHKLTAGENGIDCNRVDELCTHQEEADTRIVLHVSHAASNGHDCIAIKSPDTDVAVLACKFSHSIDANMLFCIDTRQRRRYHDMTAIGQSLGEDVRKALPGMHALTGQSSVQTVLQKECINLQFAANQRCSQVPRRTSKLPGLHLAQFPGSGSSYAKYVHVHTVMAGM